MFHPELCYGVEYVEVLQILGNTNAISTWIKIKVVHHDTVVLIFETTHIPILGVLCLGEDSHHHKMALEVIEYTVGVLHDNTVVHTSQTPHSIQFPIDKDSFTRKKEKQQTDIKYFLHHTPFI
jgi:hypothetical protein